MFNPKLFRSSALLFLAVWGGASLLPVPLRGQGLVREALFTFPVDTQQLAYSNLATLRALPNYPQIRQRLFSRRLRDFQDFLRSVDTDPEKDVDEVMLGWRRGVVDTAGFFGLAEGRFQPERIRKFFAVLELPSREYLGLDLYAFGSGEDRPDLFFTFLSSSLAAFGRLRDLKAMLDVRSGTRVALDSNSDPVGWEAELEGAAPQWGIMTGKGAAKMAAEWLTGGGKLPVDPSVALGPIQKVLYRIDWESGFSARLSILCQNAESAAALARFLNLWRDSQSATASNPPPTTAASLRDLVVQVNGPRLELSASGPIEALDPMLRGAGAGSAP